MEILQSYEFKKPSRSRYAPVVKALVEDGAPVVRLKRGEDFDQAVSLDSVQGAISTQVRAAGKTAKTFRESDDALIVALRANGEGPKPRAKKPAARQAVRTL